MGTFHWNDNRITECDISDTRKSSAAYILLYKLMTGRGTELIDSHGDGTHVGVEYRSMNRHRYFGFGSDTVGSWNVLPCFTVCGIVFLGCALFCCRMYHFISVFSNKYFGYLKSTYYDISNHIPPRDVSVLGPSLRILDLTCCHGTPLYHVYIGYACAGSWLRILQNYSKWFAL